MSNTYADLVSDKPKKQRCWFCYLIFLCLFVGVVGGSYALYDRQTRGREMEAKALLVAKYQLGDVVYNKTTSEKGVVLDRGLCDYDSPDLCYKVDFGKRCKKWHEEYLLQDDPL